MNIVPDWSKVISEKPYTNNWVSKAFLTLLKISLFILSSKLLIFHHTCNWNLIPTLCQYQLNGAKMVWRQATLQFCLWATFIPYYILYLCID